MPFPYFKSNTHMQSYYPGLMMLLSWLIALQQIFFLHSNHFEQISQIQTSISCFTIGDEDDVDGPMKDEGKSSWLSVKIRAIQKVNSTMSSPVSPSFSHQRHCHSISPRSQEILWHHSKWTFWIPSEILKGVCVWGCDFMHYLINFLYILFRLVTMSYKIESQ